MNGSEVTVRIFKLSLQREAGIYPAVLTITRNAGLAVEDPRILLSGEDRNHAAGLKYPKRRNEFVAGRWAAMEAAKIWMGDNYTKDIRINRGVFGNPFFTSPAVDVPELSIAHSGDTAAALVFPAGHQLSTDIELVRADRPGRLDAIRKNLNSKELKLAESCEEGETFGLFLFWTRKEALSKVIHCGLTVPFSLLEISETEKKGPLYICRFKNFPQYKASSISLRNDSEYIMTIVSPLYTEIQGLEKLP